MKATISPGRLEGRVVAPASKSWTQRVLAAALLHNGATYIANAGTSDDENAALGMIEALGANVRRDAAGRMIVESAGVCPVTEELYCGESGLAARLFLPIAALSGRQIAVAGSGSLLTRPMNAIVDVLPLLGVRVDGRSALLPITLKGPMTPATVTLDGGESSQFLSGLLFAFAFSGWPEDVAIQVRDLKSRPYVDITLGVLELFGKKVRHEGYARFVYDRDILPVSPITVTIPGDWSAAANFLVAGALAGDISIEGLDRDDAQADRAILNTLERAGAETRWEGAILHVAASRLHSFEYDATHCPDLFPILSVLAAGCTGVSSIRGLHRLRHKESNRAASIADMMEKLGVPCLVEADTLSVTGVNCLKGATIDSYKDHRIAMAAAVGALRANGPVTILNPGCVHKSYPGFFKDFAACGGKVNFDEL